MEMQPKASTSAGNPEPLTEPNLRSHTSLQAIAPRRTVQLYLQSIKAEGFFELPPAPILEPSVPPIRTADSTFVFDEHSGAKKRRFDRMGVEEETFYDGRDRALVLHGGSGILPVKGNRKAPEKRATTVPLRKKPSLVSTMRPRLASVPTTYASRRSQESKRQQDEERRRVNREAQRDSEEKENERSREQANVHSRKGKDRTTDSGDRGEIGDTKSILKGKGKLRGEVENEEEAVELEERLEARKERRRHKAFIRKDHSRSAKATGVAAASVLHKKREERDAESAPEESSHGKHWKTRAEKTRKRRKSAEESGREWVSALERPNTIGKGRLTLQPSNQIGLFNKGKASARIRVGRAVPDLAFSEMRFLNPTRACSASGSDEQDELDARDSRRRMRGHSQARKVSSAKTSLYRRPSTGFELNDASSSSLTDLEEVPLPNGRTRQESTRSKEAKGSQKEQIRSLVPEHLESPGYGTRSDPSQASPASTIRLQSRKGTTKNAPPTLQPGLQVHENTAAEESNFSAHSAYSLAVHRRLREANRNEISPPLDVCKAAEEHLNAEHEIPPEQEKSQEEIRMPAAVKATVLSQVDNSSPIPSELPPESKTREAKFLPSSSICTESIDQILRDNASVASVSANRVASPSSSRILAVSPQLHPHIFRTGHLVAEVKPQDYSHSFSPACLSRSLEPSFPRHQCLSDSDAVAGCRSSSSRSQQSFASLGYALDRRTPVSPWPETDDGCLEGQGMSWAIPDPQIDPEDFRGLSSASTAVNGSPSHQGYLTLDTIKRVEPVHDRTGEMSREAELNEEMLANLWHKNVL